MVHPEDRIATLQAWSIAHERGSLDVEHRIKRIDGTYRWFQSRAAPFLPTNDENAERN